MTDSANYYRDALETANREILRQREEIRKLKLAVASQPSNTLADISFRESIRSEMLTLLLQETEALHAEVAKLKDRYKWQPIAEIHEDFGDVVLVNVNDCGFMRIGSCVVIDWDATKWTHFARYAPIGQEEYEYMMASYRKQVKE